MSRLLVIIPDALSALVRKGEITDRYYNPGNLFQEVHILMTNDDRPDPAAVQKTVGEAGLYLHNLPMPDFRHSLGWQPWFLKSWVEQGMSLTQNVRPQLIRTHGNTVNGYLAAQIRNRLGIPLVVSLHNHPDADRRITPWWPGWRARLVLEFYRRFEPETLSAADCVIIVYESQRGYAIRNGARDVRLIYNIVNPFDLRPKVDYQLHDPPRVISVGRQMHGKDPQHIIRSIVGLDVKLTLVGDGTCHEPLKALTQALGLGGQVKFIKALPNDALCEQLSDYDIFAVHCDYWGIPKTVIEAMLVGLPVVVNRRHPEPTPELDGDWVLTTENREAAYRRALSQLLADHEQRAALGRRAYTYAQDLFAPHKMEQKVVDLYRELAPGL